MKIAVVQASSQISKNDLLFRYTKKYAKDSEVINYGCFSDDAENYSYLEIALLTGMLINDKTVDFVVTGCSSGQGMMLACNSIPGVLCGYTPTPMDAYLFAQINNGNAVSLPLGEEYTYSGEKNMEETLKSLFSEPFGRGYPKSEAKRKIGDANKLKEMRANANIDFQTFIERTDRETLLKVRKLLGRFRT